MKALTSLADAELQNGDVEAAKATVTRGLEKDPANAPLLLLKRKLG